MLSDLLHSDLGRRWCYDDGATQRDLVAHAHRIAALLDCAGGRVVLSCRHARSFVPGLLGAWLAGATVELLPNVQPGTLDRVDADDGVAYVLHDVAARQERSAKAIYVPGVTQGAAARATAWPELAVRMTTSGSTERPRYVTKTMAQLVDELDVLAAIIPPAHCVLSTVPLSHLYGLLFGALLPLRFGARIVSHDALLPADVAAVLERAAVDLMISTPAHLRAMLAAPMPRGLRVITSGARLPAELHLGLATAHGWRVTDVLGSTETGGIATRQRPTDAWTSLPGVTVTAPGGQLVVTSPWCGGSRVALDDRIEVHPGGTFQYLGRNHELVKIAGKRAHAHAIEATVLAIPGVTDAALVVHDVAGKEPRVALAVVVAPDATVEREAIAAAIRQQFDAVFVPRIIKRVPQIPRTERGKRSAEALRDLLGLSLAPPTHLGDQAGATPAPPAEPSGPHPRRLASLVDVRRVAPGEYLAYIPRDLVFFTGHFDELAILPGAVLVERVVWPAVKLEYPDVRAMRGIRRLRFRRPVFPEQQLAIAVKRDAGRLTFQVSCEAAAVASGQLVVE